MNSQNNDPTSTNTIVTVIGIALGLPGLAFAIFALGFVGGTLLSISIIVLIIFLLEYYKPSKLVEKSAKKEPVKKGFTVQIGNKENQGLLPKTERRFQIRTNPYVCGPALPGNSPVFYGREDELRSILGYLRHPTQAGNISVIGERRIGKSSLLNQIICQALVKVDNVIVISTSMQEWDFNSQADFFTGLHQAIGEKLSLPMALVESYGAFSNFIEQHATSYRFVFFIDEFDKMLKNDHFDANFFSQMRNLGNDPKYHWSYVLASLKPLNEITHHSIEESSFHNIFESYTLGLLTEAEAVKLIREPMQGCFADRFDQVQTEILDYAGCHPAFIQIVAGKYWTACHHGLSVKPDQIRENLRPHFQDLWRHRNEKEQACLLQIAKGEMPNNKAILEKLRIRGLLDNENQLFSPYFAEKILEEFQE